MATARVEVYTRPLCLFCHQVLELLNRARVVYQRVDVVDRPEQDRLIAKYQAPAFPIVLVDGAYMGGYAHILHLHSQGRLDRLSTQAPEERQPPGSTVAPQTPASPPTSRPSQKPVPTLMGAMSRLQKSLKEEDPSKR